MNLKIVFKLDLLGLLNAYKLKYLDRNTNGNMDEKILEGDCQTSSVRVRSFLSGLKVS